MTTAVIDDRGYPLPAFRLGTVQKVAYTGTAGTISNAVGSQTRMVRVVATTACYIVVGAAPTATTSHSYLPADTVEYLAVNGGSDKVSAIQVASGGTIYVTELE